MSSCSGDGCSLREDVQASVSLARPQPRFEELIRHLRFPSRPAAKAIRGDRSLRSEPGRHLRIAAEIRYCFGRFRKHDVLGRYALLKYLLPAAISAASLGEPFMRRSENQLSAGVPYRKGRARLETAEALVTSRDGFR